jgi:hypothetical protein
VSVHLGGALEESHTGVQPEAATTKGAPLTESALRGGSVSTLPRARTLEDTTSLPHGNWLSSGLRGWVNEGANTGGWGVPALPRARDPDAVLSTPFPLGKGGTTCLMKRKKRPLCRCEPLGTLLGALNLVVNAIRMWVDYLKP